MNLQETPFRDMLPSSVRDDPKFAAAAEVLDGMFANVHAQVKQAIIYARIDELEEPILSNLAWQFHLESFEGYGMATTLEAKRNLVKSALVLHWHKGTRWSVERIFSLLGMEGAITEWWEAPDDPDFRPYEFDIEVKNYTGLGKDFYTDCHRLIDALKNVRSHLRQLRIVMAIKAGVPFVGSGIMSSVRIKILPFTRPRLDAPPCTPFLCLGVHSATKITIYPFSAE